MYFFQLLLVMLPVLGLGLISLRYKHIALFMRILLLAVSSGALYTGATWWIANDMYRAINSLARDGVVSPLFNALEMGLIASCFGALTAPIAHLMLHPKKLNP